jgi:hypothetical protein
MYAKPEVTRYGGKELLDLMGPVETAYKCGLDGPETPFDCANANFTLFAPEGTSSFDWEGYNWILTGPDSCDQVETRGWCGPGETDCPWEPGEESEASYEFSGDLCEILNCRDSGEWTLGVELFDGKTSEPCSASMDGGPQ